MFVEIVLIGIIVSTHRWKICYIRLAHNIMAGGRKLEFDKQQALEAAMHVFWKKGFLGASLADLTEGMGINKPSLYAAFGNKESLFVQATEHYLNTYAKPKNEHLYHTGTPLRERLRNYLLAILSGQCDENNPKGCYVSLCVAEAAGETMPAQAQNTVTRAGNYAQALLTEFLQTDDEAKALQLDQEAESIALFLVTTVNGTAAMARAGKGYAELETVIDRALTGIGLPADTRPPVSDQDRC